MIPGGNAPWGCVGGHVHRVTCRLLQTCVRVAFISTRSEQHLNALHGRGVRHQSLSPLGPGLLIRLRERGLVRQRLLALLGRLVDVVDPHQEGVVHDLE